MIKDNLPIKKLKYCRRCCIPETQEGVEFDEFGICRPCGSSEDKMRINWKEKEIELKKIFDEAKTNSGNNYDCILPISGGKDSFFQAHVLTKVYNLKPLAVTFSHNWYSEIGFYNLQRCLQVFELDHLQFTPSRTLVNKLARKSLSQIGDSCWHCHSGVGSFPLQVATNFKIPLLVFGESIRENHGSAAYSDDDSPKYDRDYFNKISAKKTAEEMVDESLSAKDMHAFRLPSQKDMEQNNVRGIHLGDYIFWDEEKQTEWIRDYYGWKETIVEGTYKGYKSAECIMAGMHDFTCYLKRGFGRATQQVILDVRKGLITREEGFELIKKHDSVRPDALDYYLKITSLSEKEFYEIMDNKKVNELKGVELEVKEKEANNNNKNRMYPFVEQIIDKHLNSKDPRIKKNRD